MLNHIRTIRIKDEHAAKIIEQLSQMNALEYLDDSSINFELSAQQLALLDERSKASIDHYISSADSIKQIKKRHGL
jgi:hypothetical protein